jgi:pimeloyl-ACP methyl ester carboxylesterase
MPDIQLPEIRLYFEVHGAGAPIVCIQGTSSSAMVWGAAVDELVRLGRVVCDRRGCTRSERPEPYLVTSVPACTPTARPCCWMRCTQRPLERLAPLLRSVHATQDA